MSDENVIEPSTDAALVAAYVPTYGKFVHTVTVEAFQLPEAPVEGFNEWVSVEGEPGAYLKVGNTLAKPGDYIVRDGDTVYAVPAARFEQEYKGAE